MTEVKKRKNVVAAMNKVADERVIQMEMPDRVWLCVCNMRLEGESYVWCEECGEFYHKDCVIHRNQNTKEITRFVCPWYWKGVQKGGREKAMVEYNQDKVVQIHQKWGKKGGNEVGGIKEGPMLT